MAKNDYQMLPEELQALREQADIVGEHDVELGKFLKLLIPHVSHLYGLDPEEEDQRIQKEQQKRHEAHQKAQEKAVGAASLTPAQEESQRQAKAQGHKNYIPEQGDTLDPAAKEAQKHGIGVVPTAQEEEALANEGPANTLPASDSTYPDFSSGGSRHSGHKEKK